MIDWYKEYYCYCNENVWQENKNEKETVLSFINGSQTRYLARNQNKLSTKKNRFEIVSN